MNRPTPSARPLLPAFLLILLVFFLIFMALRLLYPATPLSRPTSTLRPYTATITHTPEVSLTPTPTPTITRTPRPTWTLRPTATQTVTPTPLPTDTPPLPIMPTWVTPLPYNDLYALRPWSPDKAAHVIDLLQAYPDTLYPDPTKRETASYNKAYTYVVYLLRETLLRFPNAPQAEGWRWELAYDLAHTNDPGVPQAYADLIQQGLDNKQTEIENLPTWFNKYEYRLTLVLHPLTPPPGSVSQDLIEIKAPGGAAYLLLNQSPSQTSVFPVTSNFDFANAIQVYYMLGDITGDGNEELVVYPDPSPGQTIPTLPQVFELSGNFSTKAFVPPSITFAPQPPFDLGTEYRQKWSINQGILQSTTTVFPACAVQMIRTYQWNGDQLAINATNYAIDPNPAELNYCAAVIDHIATQWSAAIAVPMMQNLLPAWPPQADLTGKPYPADARDEWRYRIGVYQALAGEFDQALSTLNDLIATPTAPDSHWLAPAHQFLAAYSTPSDIYRACLPAQFCDPRQALQQLLATGHFADIGTALNALIHGGVIVRSSGNFDFDNDGDTERWVLLRHHPQEQLEFWVLANSESGVKALFIQQVDSTLVRPYFHEPLDTPPIVQIEPDHGFVFARLPGSQIPYLIRKTVQFVPTTYTLDTLQSDQMDLFAGTDPAIIRNRLEELEKSDHFNCLNYRICDRFYYTLGLAYELSGDMLPAIDTYIKLWWENSDSPFMLVARLKLEVVPFTSPTPTRTRTPTRTPTYTPSPTHTLGPTATPTETETLTPTP